MGTMKTRPELLTEMPHTQESKCCDHRLILERNDFSVCFSLSSIKQTRLF